MVAKTLWVVMVSSGLIVATLVLLVRRIERPAITITSINADECPANVGWLKVEMFPSSLPGDDETSSNSLRKPIACNKIQLWTSLQHIRGSPRKLKAVLVLLVGTTVRFWFEVVFCAVYVILPFAIPCVSKRAYGGERRSATPEHYRHHPPQMSQQESDKEDSPTEVAATARSERSFLSWNEWKELGASVVFFVLCFLSYALSIAPRHRPIPVQVLDTDNGDDPLYARNLSYDEAFEHETVSDVLLIVLAALIPLLLQCALAKRLGYEGDAHASVCVYFVASGITLLPTYLVKVYVGYLRPDFFGACVPNETYSQCTDADDAASSRNSFPSGHASLSFSGLTLLTLYCHTRFGLPSVMKPSEEIENRKGPRSSRYIKDPFPYICISIASLTPMALALFIATSRIVDNLHFPADVVGGSVLGAAVANFVHGLWL